MQIDGADDPTMDVQSCPIRFFFFFLYFLASQIGGTTGVLTQTPMYPFHAATSEDEMAGVLTPTPIYQANSGLRIFSWVVQQ